MSSSTPLAQPALLISGIITADNRFLVEVEPALTDKFGPIVARSPVVSFKFTDYYKDEMGPNLIRQWVGFENLVEPDRLPEIKLATNALEQKFADSTGHRQVNLDPGILSLHNLVLATTKNYAHRVYLGKGIYAEVTLIYESGSFHPLEWTYPDYRTETCHHFLTQCRHLLVEPGLTPPDSTG